MERNWPTPFKSSSSIDLNFLRRNFLLSVKHSETVQSNFKLGHVNNLIHFNRISSFDPPVARAFAWRVLELKGQGVGEEEAMAVADVCLTIVSYLFWLSFYPQRLTTFVGDLCGKNM